MLYPILINISFIPLEAINTTNIQHSCILPSYTERVKIFYHQRLIGLGTQTRTEIARIGTERFNPTNSTTGPLETPALVDQEWV